VPVYDEVEICTSDGMCLLASLSWRDLIVWHVLPLDVLF